MPYSGCSGAGRHFLSRIEISLSRSSRSPKYLAWAGQNYWEGTRVPRSSLGVYVVFEQIEAMLPKLVSAVTATNAYHFQADKPGGADTDLSVTAWQELTLAQLDETDWREQVRRALKSMGIYGNGVLEVGVEQNNEEFIEFSSSIRAKQTAILSHPIAGPVPVPIQTERVFNRRISNEKRLKPYVRYVSVKDLYVDPNCESQRIHEAGYVVKRVYMRAEQLKALKGQPGFKIPDDDYLSNLSKSKSTANQDVTKLSAELFRYNMWNPSQDYTSDPAQKRIAVVEYTRPERKVWWLQGATDDQSIIYNQKNKYGQINYFSVAYADVLDRWYALSVSDVAEGEQRLQQAIINARIDELALAMHPPIVKRRGVTIPWYQLKRAPGKVTEVENPKEDVVQGEIANITQQSFIEVAASENRVQRITGLTDVAAFGTPSPGGNSANRTATGVNTQAGATQDRIKYIIENIEDSLINPIVNFVIKCDRKFLDTKQAAIWLQIDPRFQKLDPVKVMNTKVTAECRASAKMAGRLAFLQTFPMLAQTIFNPEFIQMLAQQTQRTLNVESLGDTLMDAINYSPRQPWFTPMTQQQIQQMNQPPAEVKMKAMLQQMQNQSDEKINTRNLQTKILDTIVKQAFGAHAKYAELDDQHLQFLLELLAGQNQPTANGGGGEGANTGTSG